jgi:hypothetical protein
VPVKLDHQTVLVHPCRLEHISVGSDFSVVLSRKSLRMFAQNENEQFDGGLGQQGVLRVAV